MANALVWLRRDLRLQDNPALAQAIADGYSPVLVYVHAPEEQGDWAPGAASRTWLHHSLSALQYDISRLGGRLIIAQGQSLAELERLQTDSYSEALYFSNLYEPVLQARDARVQLAFEKRGLTVKRFNANLLFEPWQIQTGGGTPYKVFTPFWRNASAQLAVLQASPAPGMLPDSGLVGLSVDELGLLPGKTWHMDFWQHWQPGESGAHEMLEIFCDGAIDGYRNSGICRIGLAHPSFLRICISARFHHSRSGAASIKSECRKPPRVISDTSSQSWAGVSSHTIFCIISRNRVITTSTPNSSALSGLIRTRKYCSNGSAAKPAFRLLTRACVSSGIPAGCTTAYA